VFGSIWKSLTSSKIVAFSWKLRHNRIPTKDNLVRSICVPLEENLNCVFCGGGPKTSNHLFLYCEVVFELWSKIIVWLETNMATPQNFVCAFSMLEWRGEEQEA